MKHLAKFDDIMANGKAVGEDLEPVTPHGARIYKLYTYSTILSAINCDTTDLVQEALVF